MSKSEILLAPGPVMLHPEVRRLLSLPMIHHRTPEFDEILARTLKNLKIVFATQEHVFIQTCTGSGGMECLLINVLSPGEKVLALINGKFGERWADMAEAFGAHVIRLQTPWGQPHDTQKVKECLQQNPDLQIVLSQACETSTATLNPIPELAKVIQQNSSALFLVDGITAVGALSLPMDELELDGLVAGSQKAFMLPTGLSFVSLSKRAWQKCLTNSMPRFYFDLRQELAANLRGETWFSSAVAHLRALDWVLQEMISQGLQNTYQQVKRRADMSAYFAQLLGLKLYSQSPSPTLTALLLPEGVDGQKIRLALELQDGITIMGGQDQLKGKVLRLGHMGYITDDDMLTLFEALTKQLSPYLALGLDPKQIRQLMQTWMDTHT